MPTDYLSLDAATVARLLGLLVPVLVAFLTKQYASSTLKGVVNLVASAILGGVTYLVAENGDYDWRGFVNGGLDVFVVSVVSYHAVLKQKVAPAVAAKTRNFGLGARTQAA